MKTTLIILALALLGVAWAHAVAEESILSELEEILESRQGGRGPGRGGRGGRGSRKGCMSFCIVYLSRISEGLLLSTACTGFYHSIINN